MDHRGEAAREEVLDGCKQISAKDYVLGAAGNISARVLGEERMVITPSRVSLGEVTSRELVLMDFEGSVLEGTLPPSSEWLIHREIYRARGDVGAVIHTHSKFATAASSMDGTRRIPIIDIEMVLHMGGEIEVAAFQQPGSLELAKAAVRALGSKMCALLEHHGNVCAGRAMGQALDCCDNLERSCEMYFSILAAGGAISAIPPDYLKTAMVVFRRRQKGQ